MDLVRRISKIFLLIAAAFALAGCLQRPAVEEVQVHEEVQVKDEAEVRDEVLDEITRKQEVITEDGIYHDLESVVLYYDKFGKLPSNFITKREAKDLGWEGGKLDEYLPDGAIGGDHFGNYEKRLPSGKGVKYIECDIDTYGGKRGAKRLIISNDGKYYYTPDHYETFEEVEVDDGHVVPAKK